MHFQIRKAAEPTRKPWNLYRVHPEGIPSTLLSSYETRREALLTARLLAGRGGTISEIK